MANLIEKYPVPLIFKKIHKDNLSGELVVKGENFSKKLYFSEGILESAVSDLIQDRLGEVLCRKGKLDNEQLVMLHRVREKTGEKLGKILVDYHILKKSELYNALRDQVKEIGVSTFPLVSGEWTFSIKTVKNPGGQKYKVDLNELIAEGSKIAVDFSYYKKRFNYRAPITLPIPEHIGKLLSSDEIKFYVKLTKCHSISSEEILTVTNLPEKLFWQRISLLYLLNIVDFTDFRIDSKVSKNIEALNDLHEKLQSYSIDHYQLLELKDTASVSEVAGRYFAFSKKYHPEAINTAPDSKTKEKSAYVLKKAKEAYETLSNENKKKAYDSGDHKKKVGLKTADIKKRFNPKARVLYLKAHSLYKEKKYYEAVRLLSEAVQLDPRRYSYLLLLGLSQTRIPSLRPFAEKNLLKAAELEPWNADPLFYLGQLYWAENITDKAEKYFRKALKINMEHTLAARMIREIEKSSKKKQRFSMFSKKS